MKIELRKRTNEKIRTILPVETCRIDANITRALLPNFKNGKIENDKVDKFSIPYSVNENKTPVIGHFANLSYIYISLSFKRSHVRVSNIIYLISW